MRLHDDMRIPGFIDAHVHIKDVTALGAVAAAGISAVRDAGARENIQRAVRTLKAHTNGPFVMSSGWALYQKGGYGSRFGVPVETREEIRSEILKLKRAGADIIKITASGMVSLKDPGKITVGGFKRDDLAFIVAEAASHGLGVMAHANGEQAIVDAVEAGVRSVEHGFFMTSRALDVLAKKEAFWVPTVGALERAAGSGHASREAGVFIAGLIRSHLEMIRHAYAIGVSLAVGTDCMLPDPGYHAAYHAELSYFERAGIPRKAVIKIAREGGARLLGISVQPRPGTERHG
jgi:imidazolonepropionase-like amidohydrolase